MPVRAKPKSCIYCGGSLDGVQRGEHIVQKAIGGTLTLDTVCNDCNGSFSDIDREFCSRSPASVIASKVIDSHLWQVWDVDHSAENLLVEARPDWEDQSFVDYPQIIFEKSGPQFRGDFAEMRRIGGEHFVRILVKYARLSFQLYRAGKRRCLHFEKIVPDSRLTLGYRMPPRIFTRHSIHELRRRLENGKTPSCILRFRTEADRRFALNELDNWRTSTKSSRFEIGRGSAFPSVGVYFDMGKTLRAMAKIAVNLLAHCCEKTPVNCDSFGPVINVIRGKDHVNPALFTRNGFVQPDLLGQIKVQNNAHSFRLVHLDGNWIVYSAYFGGRVGTIVVFPGPNFEEWITADLTVPLNSRQWTLRTSPLLQPLKVKPLWKGLDQIIPSAEILNVESVVRVSEVPRRKAQA